SRCAVQVAPARAKEAEHAADELTVELWRLSAPCARRHVWKERAIGLGRAEACTRVLVCGLCVTEARWVVDDCGTAESAW
ncbi:hypothetical protein EE082_27675, partial [Klebsiella pneumoniae]|nr:hypothetical protein [Klebsiella pneumoniae]